LDHHFDLHLNVKIFGCLFLPWYYSSLQSAGNKGIAELKSLWDLYPSNGEKIQVQGVSAFAIWRSLYFSKLMSHRNRAQVMFDWGRTSVFGRDIATAQILNVGATETADASKGKK